LIRYSGRAQRQGEYLIRGIGIDVVEIGRIKDMMIKYDAHFLEKVFTPGEIRYCGSRAFAEIHYAGRWASKEAFYKALPGNIQPESSWKSIEILPDESSGKPHIRILSDSVKRLLRDEGITACHLSISHERSICTAIVILEQCG